MVVVCQTNLHTGYAVTHGNLFVCMSSLTVEKKECHFFVVKINKDGRKSRSGVTKL